MRRRAGQLPNPVIGLITVLVISAFVYLVFVGIPFRGGFEVNALLRNSPQIQPGSKVRIAGVNVGKVKSMEKGPSAGLARIKLDLKDEALPLHKDATLKLRPRTFLEGGLFVDLHPGTPDSPLMDEGDTIPVASTATPVLLGHATADLRFSTRENLRLLVHSLNQSLSGGAPGSLHRAQKYAAPALLGLAQVAQAAQGQRQGDLSGGVRSGAKTIDAVASRDVQLATLLTGLNRTARALGSRREAFGESFDQLDAFLREARPALSEFNDFFPRARSFAAELRPSIRAAPATLRLSLPFLDQAQALLGRRELPALLNQADPAVRSLAKLEPPLTQTLNLALPVVECLRRNAYPVLTAKLNDPPHTTGDPVYRELLHGIVGLAGVAQNFDGNGPAVRYHAGFGNNTVSLNVPGIGDPVVGLTSSKILGSRPAYPGRLPPLHPNDRCIDQDVPNLQANTGAPPTQTSIPRERLLQKVTALGKKLTAQERKAAKR